MPHQTTLPVATRCRAVIDNDWAGDPDGLAALAHHLLSTGNRVVAVTSSFLNPIFGETDGTAARGTGFARELVGLVGGSTPVFTGSEHGIRAGAATSDASRAIVTAARADDPLPLFVVCAGPLTNIAAALAAAPDIATRFTLVWVGGAMADGVFEYNRDTDPEAAAAVFARTDLPIWQFPLETYRRCGCSVAELEYDLAGAGRVGQWLWTKFLELPLPGFVELGEVWALGDSPPVLITALNDESSRYLSNPDGPANRRIYTEVDVRMIVGDLLAKLRLHERRRAH